VSTGQQDATVVAAGVARDHLGVLERQPAVRRFADSVVGGRAAAVVDVAES
jgi:hypothetical protein